MDLDECFRKGLIKKTRIDKELVRSLIRNGINYYGTKIEFEQGKEIINKIFIIKNNISKKYLSSF